MRFLFFCFFSSLLLAQLKVEQARFRPFGISISGPKELADPVLDDLELSGVFKKSMPALADGTVQIQISPNLVRVTIKNSQTFQYKEPVSKRLAHQIAGDIYKSFTGESGFFSSHIVASNKAKQIILLDFDGTNPKQLTHNNSINILPVLSPDGKEVFFTSYLKNNSDLYSLKIGSSDLKIISNRPGINSGVSFSPNGSEIALTLSHEGEIDIYLADKNGHNLKRLIPGSTLNTSPSFSPDGNQIAFVSKRTGNPQIHIMSKDGSNIQRMTLLGKYNQAPKWSPQGDYIVFTGRDENNKFDVFLLEVKTKKITRVTQDQGDNDEASFSPNGRMLVFCSTRNGNGYRDLFVSNLDGSFQKQITHASHYWTPYWGN
ncbi:MAG: hypothetical protein WCK42_06315 [Myxococcaceae bacterium]